MCKAMDELIGKAVNEAVTENTTVTTIKTLIKFGASDDQIIKELQSECGLSESEAIEQIKKFRTNS